MTSNTINGIDSIIGEFQAKASSNITNIAGAGWTYEQGLEIGNLMREDRKKAKAALTKHIEEVVAEAVAEAYKKGYVEGCVHAHQGLGG